MPLNTQLVKYYSSQPIPNQLSKKGILCGLRTLGKNNVSVEGQICLWCGLLQCNPDFAPPSGCCHLIILRNEFFRFPTTRPKPPYGRQGLVGLFHVSGWIHFSIFATFFLHFCKMFQWLRHNGTALVKWGKKCYVTDAWSQPTSFGAKNVMWRARGPNGPFRCLDYEQVS